MNVQCRLFNKFFLFIFSTIFPDHFSVKNEIEHLPKGGTCEKMNILSFFFLFQTHAKLTFLKESRVKLHSKKNFLEEIGKLI